MSKRERCDDDHDHENVVAGLGASPARWCQPPPARRRSCSATVGDRAPHARNSSRGRADDTSAAARRRRRRQCCCPLAVPSPGPGPPALRLEKPRLQRLRRPPASASLYDGSRLKMQLARRHERRTDKSAVVQGPHAGHRQAARLLPWPAARNGPWFRSCSLAETDLRPAVPSVPSVLRARCYEQRDCIVSTQYRSDDQRNQRAAVGERHDATRHMMQCSGNRQVSAARAAATARLPSPAPRPAVERVLLPRHGRHVTRADMNRVASCRINQRKKSTTLAGLVAVSGRGRGRALVDLRPRRD